MNRLRPLDIVLLILLGVVVFLLAGLLWSAMGR